MFVEFGKISAYRYFELQTTVIFLREYRVYSVFKVDNNNVHYKLKV